MIVLARRRGGVAPPEARIGPNALTRTLEAVIALEGQQGAARVFGAAGLSRYLEQPPTGMVPEGDVTALYRAVRDQLGEDRARSVGWIAGRRTADYLLAHRIPRAAQRVLRLLPAPLSARVLCAVIARHAWTFAGSGRMACRHGHGVRIVIESCPLCRATIADAPVCDYFAGTFERLFGALVQAEARARETACAATGAPSCTFVVTWRPGQRADARVEHST